MKKTNTLIAALLLAASANAQTQTLNVTAGCVTYQFPTSLTGDMTYSDGGKTLTILSTPLATDEIELSVSTRGKKSDNTVNVAFGSDATVVTIAEEQQALTEGLADGLSNRQLFSTALSGVKLNFGMSGITHVEMESVDGYGIAGSGNKSIITLGAPEGGTLQAGQDYFITTFPCDLCAPCGGGTPRIG